MLDRLQQRLREEGYRPLRVGTPGIYLYYTMDANELYAVLLVNDRKSAVEAGITRLSQWQYANLYRRICANFEAQGYAPKVLGIVFTDEPAEAPRFHYEETWIVDESEVRLVLYEDQSGQFGDVRPIVEGVLNEANGRTGHSRGLVGVSESVFNRRSERRKYRYISLVNTVLVVINVIAFLTMFGHTENSRYLVEHGALFWPYVVERGEYYRLFTYLFLHSGYSHIVNNMLVLLFVGDNLERAAGRLRYLIIYLGSGILAGIVSMLWNMHLDQPVVCVGASGAIFGVVGALAYIVIINKGRLEDISSRQIILFVFFSLYGGLTSQGVDNAAHIGGLITGVILAALLYRRKRKIGKAESEYREAS